MTLGLSMPTLWRLVLRNDKYSSKVFKYFVEYSDKESLKKSRIESERHESTGEARPKSFQEPNPISIPHHGCSGFSVTPMPTCILWWSMFFLVWKLRATNIEYSITVQDHYARIFGLIYIDIFLAPGGWCGVVQRLDQTHGRTGWVPRGWPCPNARWRGNLICNTWSVKTCLYIQKLLYIYIYNVFMKFTLDPW